MADNDDQMEEEKPTTNRRRADDSGRRTKGRGFKETEEELRDAEDRYAGAGGNFDVVDNEEKSGPLRCKYLVSSNSVLLLGTQSLFKSLLLQH